MAEGLSVLINQALNSNLLEAVEVGFEKVKVSHLQYADDTLFLCSGNLGNFRATK